MARQEKEDGAIPQPPANQHASDSIHSSGAEADSVEDENTTSQDWDEMIFNIFHNDLFLKVKQRKHPAFSTKPTSLMVEQNSCHSSSEVTPHWREPDQQQMKKSQGFFWEDGFLYRM